MVSLAGELLGNAEELIREGLHPSEIVEGYQKAVNKVGELWNNKYLEAICFRCIRI